MGWAFPPDQRPLRSNLAASPKLLGLAWPPGPILLSLAQQQDFMLINIF